MDSKRPSWDEYFCDILQPLGTRSTCDRGYAASLFVRDNRILVTGYAGSPNGLEHCNEVGHLVEYTIRGGELLEDSNSIEISKLKVHCIRTIHAERNAIIQAAKIGVSLENSTLYSTMFPCFRCAYDIIQVGCVRVVSLFSYQGAEESKKCFQQCNIPYTIINNKELYPL